MDKQTSRALLEQDYCYYKIEESAREAVFEDAWKVGEETARRFLSNRNFPARVSFPNILQENGIAIKYFDKDYIVTNRRYFCELYPKEKKEHIYTKSVRIWCENNGFEFEEGLNILLSHEYFHYLEWYEIGLTSKRYLVPMLQLGKLRLGKTGIAALSEIGANAFADTCFTYMTPPPSIS